MLKLLLSSSSSTLCLLVKQTTTVKVHTANYCIRVCRCCSWVCIISSYNSKHHYIINTLLILQIIFISQIYMYLASLIVFTLKTEMLCFSVSTHLRQRLMIFWLYDDDRLIHITQIHKFIQARTSRGRCSHLQTPD